jgi:hypothetical protein
MSLTYRSVKGSPLSSSEADGNTTHFDTKTKDGWADIVSELYLRNGPSSPSVAQYKSGIYLYEFTSANTLEVFSNFHIPHTWKAGTMLYPHIHFTTVSNETGVVRWGFEYTSARRHDSSGFTTFGNTQTLTVDFTIPSNSADKHFVCEVPELGGIDGTNLEVDGMVLMRIYREAAHVNDTFPDSVFGITADLHIEVDRVATPNRAPNFYS